MGMMLVPILLKPTKYVGNDSGGLNPVPHATNTNARAHLQTCTPVIEISIHEPACPDGQITAALSGSEKNPSTKVRRVPTFHNHPDPVVVLNQTGKLVSCKSTICHTVKRIVHLFNFDPYGYRAVRPVAAERGVPEVQPGQLAGNVPVAQVADQVGRPDAVIHVDQ